MPEIVCTECGKTYQRIRVTKRFCSQKCRRDNYYKTSPEVFVRRARKYHQRYSERILSRQQETRRRTPWVPLVSSARSRASNKGFEFNLSNEWGRARWTGRCEVTGIEFFVAKRGPGPHPMSPSIDRVDGTKGYTTDNCRFTLWAVNAFKHVGTEADMFMVAEQITLRLSREHRPEYILSLPA